MMLPSLRNFAITFLVSLFIFAALAYFLADFAMENFSGGFAKEPETETETAEETVGVFNPFEDNDDTVTSMIQGTSFNFVLVGLDYQKDIFDDYHASMSDFLSKALSGVQDDGVGIEEKQGILLAKGNTGLVEDTVGETNVFAFGLTGNLDDLHGGEGDAVGFGKGHDVGNQYGRTGGETTDGQTALDDSLDTFGELKALLQGELGTAGVVAPIAFLDTGGLLYIEFYRTLEGEAVQENAAIFGGGEQQIDSLVESKTGDKTVLVIDMGTQRADTVRGEDVVLGLFSEEILETFVHNLYSLNTAEQRLIVAERR